MTVRQLLHSLDAREIAEWRAYARVFGPLGHRYSDNRLAEIRDDLQQLIAFSAKDYEPKHTVRPPEVWDDEQSHDHEFDDEDEDGDD